MVSEWTRYETAELIRNGVLVIGDGYRAKNSELGSTGLPFARGANINDGFHFVDADRFPAEQIYKVGNKVSEPGDVVFTSKGTVGRFAFVKPEIERFVYSPQLCFWRSLDHDFISPQFLFYWMQGREFFEQYMRVKGQTDMADYVSLSDQRRMHITLPPLPEQRAIADILGSLDDKIELNRQMNATLEATARALFQSWFVDFDPVHAKAAGEQPSGMDAATAALFPAAFEESELGTIPSGWQITTLENVTSFVLGGDWGQSEQSDESPLPALCIRGADIPSLQEGGTGQMPVRFLKESSLAKRSLKAGDLVIEISGGSPTQSTGRVVWISQELLDRVNLPLVYSNFCRVIRVETPALSSFVYLWLRNLYSTDTFLAFENGTTGIKNFAYRLFSEQYPLLVPFETILRAFADHISSLLEKMQANGAEDDVLSGLRDELLPKLVSGEVKVEKWNNGQ